MNTSRSIASIASVFFVALGLCCAPLRVSAQAVLVSEYYNASDPTAEWNEIIVVQDNLDMRGWFITDNNTNQTARQGGVRFKNIDFWKNVRAGTIIGIWHRAYPSNAITDVDTTIADGRVMIARQDAKFFDIVEWTGQPTGFNLARLGDFIQVFTKDTIHVHAIGHRDDVAPGSYWGPMPAPKTNLLQLCEDRASNRVYPGASMADYNGPNLEVRSQACAGNITRTLPNKDCNTGASNYQFWHTLRTPQWTSPTLNASVNAATVSLSWNAMTDPNPGDGVQGYLVIRDSGTTPFVPIDGRVYSNGERIGSAVVLAHVPSSSQAYADNVDLPCGVIYTYRVFAYRFGLDDEFGVSTAATTSRGRQYNTTASAFAEVLKPSGIGPVLQYTKGANVFCEGSSLAVSVPPQPGFTAQWTLNGTDIPGENSLNITARTTGRYRLKLRNAQGCLVLSDSVDVTVNALPVVEVFPKSLSLCKDSTALLQANVNADWRYEWLVGGAPISGTNTASYLATAAGDYSVRVVNTQTGCASVSNTVTLKPLDIQFALSGTAIAFPDLQDCESFKDNSTVSVSNPSATDTLRFTAIEATNFSIVSPAFPLVLAPGKQATLVLRFTPTGSAALNQTISIIAQPCGITKLISLSGRKPGAGAGVTTNVSSKDFGVNAFCGTNPTAQDSIIITVSSPTTITAIDVPSPFSVSAADKAGFAMAAGESRVVRVTFSSNSNPFQTGKSDCVIRYTAGACSDSLKVNLRGSFTLPQLLADVSVLKFDALDSCSALSRDTIINVTNPSAVDIFLDQLSETSLQILEVPVGGSLRIPAAQTIRVTLRFAPNGYQSVSNKRVLFSAQPCLDVSGFIYSGERRQVSVGSVTPSFTFGTVSSCNGVAMQTQSGTIDVTTTPGALATITDIRSTSSLLSTSLKIGQTFGSGSQSFTVSLASGTSVPPGPFSAKLYISFEPCGVQREINITADFVGAEILLSSTLKKDTVVDIGTIDTGVRVLRSLRFRNTSSVPVTLGQLVAVNPPFAYTLITNTQGILQPQEEAFIDVVVLLTDTGRYQVTIPFSISQPCQDTVFVTIVVNGKSGGVNPLPFHFELDHQTATVGTQYSIPVHIKGTGIDGRALSAADVTVNYNPTLFLVSGVRVGPALSGFTASASTTTNGIRLSARNGTRVQSEGVAWYIDGTVLLGDVLSTPLAVDTSGVSITSAELTPEAPVNGSLTIEGSCRLSDRLLNVGGTFTLMRLQVDPQSRRGTIAYETIGEQHTRIEVYDVNGNRVAVVVDGTVPAGKHESVFSCRELSQGAYMLVIQNGMHRRSLPFTLIH
ncbi:MAG: hypothetical protein ACK5JL_02995 [Candidatus Kapaibacterium sp.]|jgi:hypothetical protein